MKQTQGSHFVSGLANIDWSDVVANAAKHSKVLLSRMGWQTQSPLLWVTKDLSTQAIDRLAARHQILKKKLVPDLANKLVLELTELKAHSETEALLTMLQFAYSVDRIAPVTEEIALQNLGTQFAELEAKVQESAQANPLMEQLLTVELALVLGLQMGQSLQPSVIAMDSLVERYVDGDGWISAEHLANYEALIASFSRCHHLLKAADTSCEESTQIKLEWMSRQWIRLIGPTGDKLMLLESADEFCKPFKDSILAMSGDDTDKQLFKIRTTGAKPKNAKKVDERLNDGCSFSEWGKLGVFQSGWKKESPRVAFAANEAGLKLHVANVMSLLKGVWVPRVTLDEVPVEFEPKCEINVWHSDEEVEYVEFEFQSESGCVLQRQVMLARDDQFLLLADAILPDRETGMETMKIEYRGSIPIAEEAIPLLESDNREVYLKSDSICGLVLPLGLGEWKTDGDLGSLQPEENSLVLSQVAMGAAMYAPLLIDLSAKRCTSPRTWRSLTVAEELRILGRDEAVAFRVQLGQDQWVIYRSLSGVASRTFLGENQICEFFVGKTDGDTAADELIQLE